MTERLTYDGNFCDIALCMDIKYGQSCPDGACSQRKVWERLKAYEDAMPLERVQELAKAEREAQRWVPMSERFPTEKDADRLGFIIAHSDSMGQSTVCVWHHVLDDGVTSHWMMLPAPPEEGAEK